MATPSSSETTPDPAVPAVVEPPAAPSPPADLSPPAAPTQPGPITPTRTSGLWLAVVGFAVLLLLLAIFLLQNGQRVHVSYLGTNTRLPLAVAMLLSAVAGALLVAVAGVARVLQLRRSARRQRKARRG